MQGPPSSRKTDTSNDPATGTPRWVKLVGIAVAMLVLMVVVMMLVGGGKHGPARHLGLPLHTPLESVQEQTPLGRTGPGHLQLSQIPPTIAPGGSVQ